MSALPPEQPGRPDRRVTFLIAGAGLAAAGAAIAIALAVDSGDSGKGESRATADFATTATFETAPPPQDAPIAGRTLTIYASVPLQGAAANQGRAIEDGAQLALDDARGRAGAYRIRYVRLDDSLAVTGSADEGKAAQNARQAISDRTAIGYIGDYNSGISKVTIPMLNRVSIAQVSPSNTYVGLTSDAPGSEPGEPDKYYPSGRRTYARLMPNDTVQSAALAVAAKESGCKSIRIWDTKTTYSSGLAELTSDTSRKIGLKVSGHDSIDPQAPNYRALAGRIDSDCFVFTGEVESNGVQAVTDAAAAPSVRWLFSGDGMCLDDVAKPQRGIPARNAASFRCTIGALDPDAYPPSGQRVLRDYARKFGGRDPVDPVALYGYESMALLLDAIERASASGRVSRGAVAAELFRTHDRESPLGTYSINSDGDTSITDYGLYKISSRRLVFDRVVDASP